MIGQVATTGQVTGRSRGAALAATLVAALALYLIVRAAAGTLGYSSPVAAAFASSMPPADVRGQVRLLARAAGMMPQFVVGEREKALAERALASAPTSYEPFVIAAKLAEKEGRLDRAIRLMEEVRRRRPHLPSARLQLIVLYGKARRFGDLLGELDMAIALNREARTLVLPELTKLTSDPEGRAALARMLARQPSWRHDFYKAGKGRKIRPDDALALANAIQARTGQAGGERGFYLQALIEAGDLPRARAIWLSQLPPDERAKGDLVFDPDFQGSSAPEPFNWVFHDSGEGRAERRGDRMHGGIAIFYFGGRNVTFLEQALALPPGRYRLSFKVRSEEGIKSGELSWRVACGSGEQTIAAVSLNGAGTVWTGRSAVFNVSSDCSGQRLYLMGTPGDISGQVRAEIVALELKRDA